MKFIYLLQAICSFVAADAFAQANHQVKLELQSEIEVAISERVGSISQLVPVGDRLMLLDPVANAVYISDSELQVFERFDWESCHPGVPFRPLTLIPLTPDKVLISSGALGGYLLSLSTGKCSTREAAVVKFFPTPHMASTGNGVVVLRYYEDDEFSVEIKFFDSNLNLLGETNLSGSSDFKHIRSLFMINNGIVYKDSFTWILNPFDASIYKLTERSQFWGKAYKIPIQQFKGPTRDLTSSEVRSVADRFSLVNDILTGKDYVEGLYQISSGHLLVHIRNIKEHVNTLHICDNELKSCVILGTLSFDEGLLNAFDNKLYVYKRNQIKGGNPIIRMYKVI